MVLAFASVCRMTLRRVNYLVFVNMLIYFGGQNRLRASLRSHEFLF
jgi:hypothetical protein